MNEQLVSSWPSVGSTDQVLTTVSRAAPILRPANYSVDFDEVEHRTMLRPSIHLFNVPLNVRSEGGIVFIESEHWPLLSSFGDDFQQAVGNMHSLLKDVIADYVFVTEDLLAEDAVHLRRYLIGRIFES